MKFKRHSKIEKGKLDMTPLIDVILQLLIFFMLSSSFVMQSGIKINLPNSSHKEKEQKKENITVSLTKESHIFLDENKVLLPELKETFNKEAQKNPKIILIIRADAKVPHGEVVEIMDIAKQSGLSKISIATQTKNI